MSRFSLGQLLVFVFACCVYLAALRSPFASAKVNELLWVPVVTHVGAWLVLFVLYCRWRLTASLTVHFAAFAVAFVLIYILSRGHLPTTVDGIVHVAFINVVWGCALGTLISFPVAILTIAIRGLGAKRGAK